MSRMDTVDRHALEIEDLSDDRSAHLIAHCLCGWSFEDRGTIGYSDDAVRRNMYTYYRMHVDGTTN